MVSRVSLIDCEYVWLQSIGLEHLRLKVYYMIVVTSSLSLDFGPCSSKSQLANLTIMTAASRSTHACAGVADDRYAQRTTSQFSSMFRKPMATAAARIIHVYHSMLLFLARQSVGALLLTLSALTRLISNICCVCTRLGYVLYSHFCTVVIIP